MPLINKTPGGGSGGGVDNVTAKAKDVLSPKIFVDANGDEVTGTMTNNGAINKSITENGSYTIPAGYHNGSGKYTIDVPLDLDTSDATASAWEIKNEKSVYVNAIKVTGTMPDTSLPTPTMGVNSSGKVTSSCVVSPSGYITASSKQNTLQLTKKAATTYTPGTSNQTISAGQYLTGAQTIKGDSNLVSSNIKSGETIFGVSGGYTPGLQVGSAYAVLNSSTGLYEIECPAMPEIDTGVLVLLHEGDNYNNLKINHTTDYLKNEFVDSLILKRESTNSNSVYYTMTSVDGSVVPSKWTATSTSLPVKLTYSVGSSDPVIYSITLRVSSAGLLYISGVSRSDVEDVGDVYEKYTAFML